MIRLYNSRSREIEEFRPLHGNRVYMFVCGPTVYDHSHIGHARTYLAYDIIARYLRLRGYSVFYLMNITDVDDKIIRRANESGVDPLVLADTFTNEFSRDMTALGISSISLHAKASEHVPEIVSQISTLISKGYGYQVEGDVYFDISRFPDYGRLSRQNTNQLVMHRIDPNPRKRNPADFALWKSMKPAEPHWNSPWGEGRPGWHIEDTAITVTYFGPQYDLHGGGLDLIFPHHEAEIAQAEAATGVSPLVKYWIHAGLLMVKGARMGKSMGNFITVKDILRTHDAEALRLYFSMSHYRSQLDFDESHVEQAEEVLDKLRSIHNQFKLKLESASRNHGVDTDVERLTSSSLESFMESMDDDFNTPRALAVIIGFSKDIEPYAAKIINYDSIELILKVFDYFGETFGILRPLSLNETQVFQELLAALLRIREKARKDEDWATADHIRSDLIALGIELEDTPAGARWYISSRTKK